MPIKRCPKCGYLTCGTPNTTDKPCDHDICPEGAAQTAPVAPPTPEAPNGIPTMADIAEMLWVVLANVSGGDWTQQSAEWREAAARWRDYYFAAERAAAAPPQGGNIKIEPKDGHIVVVDDEVWPRRRNAGNPPQGWQPIATAPMDGTEVLLCESHNGEYACIEHGSWGFVEQSDWDGMMVYGWCSDTGSIDEPTHWMPPLPAPPEVPHD
jgi:hypothetical protein